MYFSFISVVFIKVVALEQNVSLLKGVSSNIVGVLLIPQLLGYPVTA